MLRGMRIAMKSSLLKSVSGINAKTDRKKQKPSFYDVGKFNSFISILLLLSVIYIRQ